MHDFLAKVFSPSPFFTKSLLTEKPPLSKDEFLLSSAHVLGHLFLLESISPTNSDTIFFVLGVSPCT